MHCDPDVKEHLHHAKEQVRHAVDVAAERLVNDDVRGHLRNAARHMLHAGIAALDADQRHRAERAAKRAAAHHQAPGHAPVHNPEPPPAT